MVHLNPEAIAYMQKYNHKDILLSIKDYQLMCASASGDISRIY